MTEADGLSHVAPEVVRVLEVLLASFAAAQSALTRASEAWRAELIDLDARGPIATVQVDVDGVQTAIPIAPSSVCSKRAYVVDELSVELSLEAVAGELVRIDLRRDGVCVVRTGMGREAVSRRLRLGERGDVAGWMERVRSNKGSDEGEY